MAAGYCKCTAPHPSPNNLACMKCDCWLWEPAWGLSVRLLPTETLVMGEKRFNVPYVLQWQCTCGEQHARDYSDEHYLAHPKFGQVNSDTLWCPSCDAEHKINLKVNITLEIA